MTDLSEWTWALSLGILNSREMCLFAVIYQEIERKSRKQAVVLGFEEVVVVGTKIGAEPLMRYT